MYKTSYQAARDDDVSVSDVASCKVFFPCNEASGATLTDIVNGVIYTPSALTFPTANAVRPVDTDLQSVSGSFPTFSTDPIIGVMCGKITDLTAFRAACGDNSSTGSIGISNLTRSHAAVKGTSAGFGVAEFVDAQVTGNVGEDVFLAFQYNPGVNCVVDLYKKDGTLLNSETTSTAAVTANLGEVLPTSHMRMNGADFYGLALFSVSSIPSDFLIACHEMLLYWSEGYKSLPARCKKWS